MDTFDITHKVVNLLPHKDINSSAHSTAYVNLENYRHVELVINVGANGAGTKAVTLKEATNTSGSSAATITTVDHYYTNAAALASSSTANDTHVKTSLSSGTFNIAASTDNLVYIIPVDAEKLSDGFTHLGVGVAATSAACIAGCIAICKEPRYAAKTAMD